jgi:hypothetical protein
VRNGFVIGRSLAAKLELRYTREDCRRRYDRAAGYLVFS